MPEPCAAFSGRQLIFTFAFKMKVCLFLLTTVFALCAFADQTEIPTTLDEAHLQLEKKLPKEELIKIDAMTSEDQMIEYHRGLGMGVRNSWGLWRGGPLAKHLNGLGFTHPDDMSSVVLETFWCKRHGKDFHLKERSEYFARYWKGVADPPETAKDPQDSSDIEWIYSFGFGDDRLPREIHIGKNKKNGRLLAYEYDKGVYVPDKEVLAQVTKFESETK